jgi:hypothetical protein
LTESTKARRWERARAVGLSTPFLGAFVAVLTWPVSGVRPAAGLDPSWIAGLYMAAERGMDFGTQIVFTYGPLGFLVQPGLWDVWLGRVAFLWTAAAQIALCVGLLWASRRAFGLVVGLLVTTFAATVPMADAILLPATVVGVAALLEDWGPRARFGLAIGAGTLAGMELLSSLRAGPTLVVMAAAVLLGLPGRRRTLPAFVGSLLFVSGLLWFVSGQGLDNLGAYAANTASIVGDFSAAMVYTQATLWWQAPGMIVGLATVAVLCAAAAWRLDNARRVGLVVMVAAIAFLTFKHAVIRESPGGVEMMFAGLLAVGLALAPYVRRAVAIAATLVLVGITYVGMADEVGTTLDLPQRVTNFRTQLGEMAIPGRAEDAQRLSRESMQAEYGLGSADLALLRSGGVHIAPWEVGVAWAYDLGWDPLPVFQQYAAYNTRLDELNAAKLESATAPNLILWGNTSTYQADKSDFPGAIDSRWPAFESPAEMVQMLCRYPAVRWDASWAVLRRRPSRCGHERPLRTVVAGNGEAVRLPPTRSDEALLVRVDGLAVSGVEKLRTLLYRAAMRHFIFQSTYGNIVGATAADGLLLRVPRWADYPGKFALDSESPTVGFERFGGFLTGVDDSTELTLSFSALPLRGSAVLPRFAAAQNRRVQR